MENSKQINVRNCVKYIIFAGVIYAVLRVVPSQKLSNLEISVLVCVILLGIFSLDCLTSKKNNKEEMSNSKKMFDLDLDVDLDFDKLSDVKENVSDVNKKNRKKYDLETNDSEEEISGIDMKQVKKELAKRNLDLLESETERVNKREERRVNKKDNSRVNKREERRANKKDNSRVNRREEERRINKSEERRVNNREIPRDNSEQESQITSKIEEKTPKINCEVEVLKMRREMQQTIQNLRNELKSKTKQSNDSKIAKKYLSVLIADLLEKQIIDKSDVENLNAKLVSGTSTLEELLQSLEKLKLIGTSKKKPSTNSNTNMKYSDLPAESYKPLGEQISNKWTNEYSILNTDKWQVPQPRPPVCISNSPCKVCPTNTGGYPTNLKEWNNSSKISNTNINKKWALDQEDLNKN